MFLSTLTPPPHLSLTILPTYVSHLLTNRLAQNHKEWLCVRVCVFVQDLKLKGCLCLFVCVCVCLYVCVCVCLLVWVFVFKICLCFYVRV